MIRFLPLRRRAQFLMQTHRVSLPPLRPILSPAEICRVVEIAGHVIPGVTCLVKAHVGSAMLNRFGHAAEIKIGVLKNSADFKAHAWVECDGLVVLGGTENQYVEMPKIARTAREFEQPVA